MVLRMSRPVRHPTTEIYWYRKRVPDSLRSLVGKRQTKGIAPHTRPCGSHKGRWHRLTSGAQDLPHRPALAIARRSGGTTTIQTKCGTDWERFSLIGLLSREAPRRFGEDHRQPEECRIMQTRRRQCHFECQRSADRSRAVLLRLT